MGRGTHTHTGTKDRRSSEMKKTRDGAEDEDEETIGEKG